MYNWLDRIPTDQIIEWREYLHQHPELSFNLFLYRSCGLPVPNTPSHIGKEQTAELLI